MGTEGEPQVSGQLPIISKEIANRIREELDLDISASTKSVLEGITKVRQTSKYEKSAQMAADIFYDVVSVNPNFAEAIRDGIKTGFVDSHDATYRSFIAMGMALVLKAFHYQSEFGLLENLKTLGREHFVTEIVRVTVAKALGDGKRMDLLETALFLPRISDAQLELNDLINEAFRDTYGGTQSKMGAAAMYKLLSEFKPKLFPSDPTPPAQQSSNI